MKYVGLSNAYLAAALPLLPKFKAAMEETKEGGLPMDAMLFSPLLVNSAFSMELSLKAIYVFENNAEHPFGHDLWELWEDLKSTTQQAILTMGAFDQADFEMNLKKNRDAFEEIRYLEVARKKKREEEKTGQPGGGIEANPVALLQVAQAALNYAKQQVAANTSNTIPA